LKVESSNCVFTQGLEEQSIMLPVAHAEGKLYAQDVDLAAMEAQQLVALRYAYNGAATQRYPYNPNGSLHAIAGMCDEAGHVFGLMPHPERFVYDYQSPARTREIVEPVGRRIFENAVRYAQGL